VIDDTLSKRSHNHPFKVDLPSISSKAMIKSVKECNPLEVSFIISLGPSSLGIAKVREILATKFPGREFDSALLHRLLKKGFDLHFGTDPDCVSKFMEMGYDIRNQGGVFDVKLAADCRITEVFVQKSTMRPYASRFGDFVIHDGTYNVDRYGFIALVLTLVDSLGKSVMVGYSLASSEHSEHIKEALHKFGLDQPGNVYMTDQAPAFIMAAEQISKNHLLFTNHYTSSVFSARSGRRIFTIG
jgi:hypothetical protein